MVIRQPLASKDVESSQSTGAVEGHTDRTMGAIGKCCAARALLAQPEALPARLPPRTLLLLRIRACQIMMRSALRLRVRARLAPAFLIPGKGLLIQQGQATTATCKRYGDVTQSISPRARPCSAHLFRNTGRLLLRGNTGGRGLAQAPTFLEHCDVPRRRLAGALAHLNEVSGTADAKVFRCSASTFHPQPPLSS